MNSKVSFLQNLFNDKIPVTKYLGLKVNKYDENGLTINAPLLDNRNDKNTAFAGSLYSVSALAGWGFLTLKFKEANVNATVVMYKADVSYNKPVTSDFQAICTLEDKEIWEKLKTRVVRKKNGKITLPINIYHVDDKIEPKATMTAEYFAWLNS